MATIKKPKKYQNGGAAETAKAILAKKAASDSTTKYDYSRDENDAPSWAKKINVSSKKPTGSPKKAKSGAKMAKKAAKCMSCGGKMSKKK